MDRQIRDIAYFISFSIEQYMNEKGLDENQVISIFSEHNILDYLNEHYEVLHTITHWVEPYDVKDGTVEDAKAYMSDAMQRYGLWL